MKTVVFWILIKITVCGRLCMKCNQVIHPTACDTVVRCSDHEECHITRYADVNGETLYDVGCLDKRLCQSHTHRYKRFLVTDHRCRECCNDTDVCNLGGLCNTTDLNHNDKLLCYECEQRHSVNSCPHITLCGQDQSCFIGKKEVGLFGIPVFETKCMNTKVECPLFEALNTTSGLQKCAKCCNTSFCNNECSNNFHLASTVTPTVSSTVTSTMTPYMTSTISPTNSSQCCKPVISQIGGISSVILNTDVRLFCSVSGTPKPTVGWNFLSMDLSVKNMYIEGNGRVLVILNYQHYNDGKYRCWATNSLGTTEKDIVLSGKS